MVAMTSMVVALTSQVVALTSTVWWHDPTGGEVDGDGAAAGEEEEDPC